MRTVVLKFGGTSMEDAAAIRRAVRIVDAARASGARAIVVASAMARVTDTLLQLASGAAGGATTDRDDAVRALWARHADAIADTGGSTSALAALENTFGDLRSLLDTVGAARCATPADRDAIAAVGELASTRVLTAALEAAGIPAAWIDPREVVATDDTHQGALPLMAETAAAAAHLLMPLVDRWVVPVIGGFVGRSTSGATTTLGRGGSDYSASVVGAAVGADEIQIWTDVDGMLTGDPRVIEEPRVVEQLSFAEASELAYFGAKVLHPSTIQPAIARGIPIRILNSRRPEAGGTCITAESDSSRGVTAVACKRGVTVIDVTSTRMLMAYGFLRRVFEVFERFRTPVDVVTTSEVSVSMTVDDRGRLDEIVSLLREFATVDVEPEMAIVCAVGENLRAQPEAVPRAIAALSSFPLRMISQAASRRNFTVVLPERCVVDAMRALHGAFFEALSRT